MKKKWTLSGSLVLCLALTACGGKKDGENGGLDVDKDLAYTCAKRPNEAKLENFFDCTSAPGKWTLLEVNRFVYDDANPSENGDVTCDLEPPSSQSDYDKAFAGGGNDTSNEDYVKEDDCVSASHVTDFYDEEIKLGYVILTSQVWIKAE